MISSRFVYLALLGGAAFTAAAPLPLMPDLSGLVNGGGGGKNNNAGYSQDASQSQSTNAGDTSNAIDYSHTNYNYDATSRNPMAAIQGNNPSAVALQKQTEVNKAQLKAQENVAKAQIAAGGGGGGQHQRRAAPLLAGAGNLGNLMMGGAMLGQMTGMGGEGGGGSSSGGGGGRSGGNDNSNTRYDQSARYSANQWRTGNSISFRSVDDEADPAAAAPAPQFASRSLNAAQIYNELQQDPSGQSLINALFQDGPHPLASGTTTTTHGSSAPASGNKNSNWPFGGPNPFDSPDFPFPSGSVGGGGTNTNNNVIIKSGNNKDGYQVTTYSHNPSATTDSNGNVSIDNSSSSTMRNIGGTVTNTSYN